MKDYQKNRNLHLKALKYTLDKGGEFSFVQMGTFLSKYLNKSDIKEYRLLAKKLVIELEEKGFIVTDGTESLFFENDVEPFRPYTIEDINPKVKLKSDGVEKAVEFIEFRKTRFRSLFGLVAGVLALIISLLELFK